MMGCAGGAWGMGWWGLVVMLLCWVLLVLILAAVVRVLFPGERRSERETALDILRRRYAAGEISQAEYEQVRRVLGQ
jgi:putative membrane protein